MNLDMLSRRHALAYGLQTSFGLAGAWMAIRYLDGLHDDPCSRPPAASPVPTALPASSLSTPLTATW